MSSKPKAEVSMSGGREVLTWDLDGVDFNGRITVKAEVVDSARIYLNMASVDLQGKTILTNPTCESAILIMRRCSIRKRVGK